MILIYYKTWKYQCLIIQVKSPSIDMVSCPGLGSDPPFGSDRDLGRDRFHHRAFWFRGFIMFIEIPPCSPDHIRRVVFRGSLPMPGFEVPWHHV